ncbi:hypothetical protein THAOC_22209, partial [Thalassiosira oceanica]
MSYAQPGANQVGGGGLQAEELLAAVRRGEPVGHERGARRVPAAAAAAAAAGERRRAAVLRPAGHAAAAVH